VCPGEVCLIGWLLNSPGQCYIDTGVGVGARLRCRCPFQQKKKEQAKCHLKSDTGAWHLTWEKKRNMGVQYSR